MQDSNTLWAAPRAWTGSSAGRPPATVATRFPIAWRRVRSCARDARRKSAAWLKPSSCISSSRRRPVELLQAHGAAPRVQQAAGVLGCEVAADRALPGIRLAQQPGDHPHHPRRIHPRAAVTLGEAQRPHRQRDRGVGPLGGAALGAAGRDRPVAQVLEELGRTPRPRRLGEGPTDIDPGVIVAACDADALARGDVGGGGLVELRCPCAVSNLPDGKQLRQAATVTGEKGCSHRVVGMSERARYPQLVEVFRTQFDVGAVSLKPFVNLPVDSEAEHVNRLRLITEVGRQLLRDEHVGPVGDLEHAGDRVVIGDRHEVHATTLGQLVDLLGRGGTLRQADGTLYSEPGLRGGTRVTVEISSAPLFIPPEHGFGGAHDRTRFPRKQRTTCDKPGTMV